ncbi:hypothetical protein GCM10023320_49250 [Pseudonocardia adelaidensis]|uniref:Uncharacterized protein n=1 Tax=Pseudonocardia adelaidensis TaxID=648754 RepID=A0ABP9NS80_9PSEU
MFSNDDLVTADTNLVITVRPDSRGSSLNQLPRGCRRRAVESRRGSLRIRERAARPDRRRSGGRRLAFGDPEIRVIDARSGGGSVPAGLVIEGDPIGEAGSARWHVSEG